MSVTGSTVAPVALAWAILHLGGGAACGPGWILAWDAGTFSSRV